jgi:hypothetical protein
METSSFDSLIILDIVNYDRDEAVEMISCDDDDEWDIVDVPDEKELVSRAVDHGLENNAATRAFIEFISLTTNFANFANAQIVNNLPPSIESVRDLRSKIREEIKGYADDAILFDTLAHLFFNTLINTERNMEKALPFLEKAVYHMSIMAHAMPTDSESPLSSRDLLDIDLAINKLVTCIEKLSDCAKSSREESSDLYPKIESLKDRIETKIDNKKKQISFAKLAPITVGAPTGMFSLKKLQ